MLPAAPGPVFSASTMTQSRIPESDEPAAPATCGAGVAQMAQQRNLPMGAHDETAWGDEHLRAFEKFVTAQSQVLALLKVAADRDQNVLESMTGGTP